jgi:hypothetical protein
MGRIVTPIRQVLPCRLPLFWGKEIVTLVTFPKGKKCAAGRLMSNELNFFSFLTKKYFAVFILHTTFIKGAGTEYFYKINQQGRSGTLT